MTRPVVLPSLSAAMDGGFTAIADVLPRPWRRAVRPISTGSSVAWPSCSTSSASRFDVPLRATGDADFGVPPPRPAASPNSSMRSKPSGTPRWRGTGGSDASTIAVVATVDLLIPTYRSRARETVTVGSVVTTEVPGLAEALRRPAIATEVEMVLTDGATLSTIVSLPDAIGMLALKTMVRTVRTEVRDAEDLWRCLEVAAADGAEPATFDSSEPLRRVRAMLWREMGPNGAALAVLTADLQERAGGEAAAQDPRSCSPKRSALRRQPAERISEPPGGGTFTSARSNAFGSNGRPGGVGTAPTLDSDGTGIRRWKCRGSDQPAAGLGSRSSALTLRN